MKQFLKDQALLTSLHLLLVIGTIAGAIFAGHTKLAFSLGFAGAVAGFSMCIKCKYLLLLPLDLLIGERTEIVQFSYASSGIDLKFQPSMTCQMWKFYSGMSKKFRLLIPVPSKCGQPPAVQAPVKDQKIKIYYYRFSGILCGWEPVTHQEGNRHG